MPLSRGGRAVYDPVASSESNDDDENNNNNNNNIRISNTGSRANNQQRVTATTSSSRPSRSTYNHIGSTEIATNGLINSSANGNNRQIVTLETVSKEDTPLTLTSSSIKKLETEEDDFDDNTTSNTNLTVIILDSAQKKFPIPCHSQWSVGKFKRVSSRIHKVPPTQQRLIFRGKMLTNDAQKLADVKIDTDNAIIHLFPKPRVVVTSNNDGRALDGTTTLNGGSGANTSSLGGDVGGAHVPSIVIDQDEQERRGQILVLGSVEIAESQNNVKMLSLLLLVICSMRLLALFSIAVGVAEEPASSSSSSSGNNATHHHTEDGSGGSNTAPPYNEPEMEVRAWQTSDFFDLIVSAIGFYVATLGMKATQENTLRLANAYMIGTIIAGIGWNVWNVFLYIVFYQEQTVPRDDDDMVPLTRDDFITVAFFTVALPLFVWGVCCARAWEFRRLIEEAEEEAAERIRSQLTMSVVEEGPRSEEEDLRPSGINNNGAGSELMDLSSSSRTEIV